MAKYRKHPVVIDAWSFAAERQKAEVHGATFRDPHVGNSLVFDNVQNTWVGVNPDDYIIRGLRGEFYPIAREIFEQSYEPAE